MKSDVVGAAVNHASDADARRFLIEFQSNDRIFVGKVKGLA